MKKLAVIFICFTLLILPACIGRALRKGFTKVKEKREITLYSSVPANAIFVRVNPKDSWLFCINRDEMMHAGDSIIRHTSTNYDCRKLLISDHLHVIDSVQKTNGFVDLEKTGLCEYIFLGKLVIDLLSKGHLWIRYTNGKYVKKLLYIKKRNKVAEQEYYEDKSNLKVMYNNTRNVHQHF